MDWDDLEPIDLEPVDPDSGGASRFDRERPRERRTAIVWIGVIVVALGAWAAIALTNQGGRRQTLPPPSTTLPPPVTVTTPIVLRITELAPRLWDGLRGIGSGRFAIVVDDRLYLLDEASTEAETTLVPLPEGHVTIDDQNGSSLLASTFQQTIVSTTPVATRTLSVRDGAFRAVAPERWWLGRGDGDLRDDLTGAVVHVPTGLSIAAAVQQGFVAVDAKSQWVLWSSPSGATTHVTTISPSSGGQLLAAGPHAIAILYACVGNSCPIEVIDTASRERATMNVPLVPQFGAFSPDGRRLALASSSGGVDLLDTTTMSEVVEVEGLHPVVPSLPLSWTSDSRTLLVVGANAVEIIRDGVPMRDVTDTVGLEQLVALP
jgi:hypothetical protein